jgi:hypothetical protein
MKIRHLTAIMLSMACLCVAANGAPPPAAEWEIGPVIKGRNYSVGMPLNPTPQRTGWSFQFPNPTVDAGHVHYLTFSHGPMTGKKRIVMRYRIDAARTVRFVPQEHPDLPAKLSLFFQREGDRWNAKGRYGEYRWYSPGDRLAPVAVGTHEIIIRLDDPSWISVWGKPSAQQAAGFSGAIDNADRVGFVLGSAAARGHGVFATGPAKFTVLEFRVE